MAPSVEADVPAVDLDTELFPIDTEDFAKSFKMGQRNLNKICTTFGESIPPLIKQYMGLSPKMKTFGTFINADFGDVEETGILIPIDTIYDDKKERYIRL